MVVPDAALVRLGSGLREKFAFFTNAEDGAASTSDPKDTGADLRRLGRIAGYVRGRNAVGAFEARGPRNGLVTAGTSVILWRDARSARASIERDVANDKRYAGKTLPAGFLVSVATTKVPSLGRGAVLARLRTRPKGGTDRFTTQIAFHIGPVRANAIIVRRDANNADAAALQLARQLKRRILAALR